MTDSLAIDDAKAELRRRASQTRRTLSDAARMDGARRVASTGLGFLSHRAGAVVSGYHPLGNELDPRALLARLAGEGNPIVLPITPKSRSRLTFRAWKPGDPLVEGLFGVREPAETAPLREPAILLVPLLAFDAAGHRLGYGAGYYDRTLSDLRAKGPAMAIGLAFAEQQVDSVPHDRYDQRLDWILTPDGARRREE